MPFELPPLPYAHDALEPAMSATTVRFHHDGHQARYFRTTNDMLRGFRAMRPGTTLRQLVGIADAQRRRSHGSEKAYWEKLFDQASQAWTHTLYWHSMRPNGGGALPRTLASFGRLNDIHEAFKTEAKNLFGSGWVWLYLVNGIGVKVKALPNAEQPPGLPLMVMDIWEHAYYLDYPDAKGEFVDVWLKNLANWEFAERMLRGDVPPELR